MKSNFTQVVPDEGGLPSFRTEVRFITDRGSLFISFRAYDPDPGEIVANLMERDSLLFFDDNFTIVLDTFHDKRNAYFFQISAGGANGDGLMEGGFCFVEFYAHGAAEAAVSYLAGTKLDSRVIRVDLDAGFEEGRQYGRGRTGGQVRDEHRGGGLSIRPSNSDQ